MDFFFTCSELGFGLGVAFGGTVHNYLVFAKFRRQSSLILKNSRRRRSELCSRSLLVVSMLDIRPTTRARIKLQASSEDFKIFSEEEWMRQCRRISRHNILEQHFAVKCLKFQDEVTWDDDGSDDDDFGAPRKNDAPFKMWLTSAWLYQVAIHDSNKDIETAKVLPRLEIISDCSTVALTRWMRTCH